jgi:hypothetical protein
MIVDGSAFTLRVIYKLEHLDSSSIVCIEDKEVLLNSLLTFWSTFVSFTRTASTFIIASEDESAALKKKQLDFVVLVISLKFTVSNRLNKVS